MLCALPIKPFRLGKRRLAPAVARDRAELNRAMAATVLDACRRAGTATIVITGDPEVRRWAAERGAETMPEPPGGGLDGAAAAVAALAAERGIGFAVVHADLPLLTPEDVTTVAGALRPGGAVLAPSRDGGTNVLAATEPLGFRYGPGSFRRHLAELARRDPVVVVRPGLCLDLDGPRDLEEIARLAAGRWLHRYVAVR